MQERRGKSPIVDNVDEFLREFKAMLRYQPGTCDWRGRMGYDAGLPGLGLTQKQAEDLICDELRPGDCVRGPEPEDQNPDTACICIFRLRIELEDCDAYAKLALHMTRRKSGQFRGIIWSFKRWNQPNNPA